MNSGCGSLKNSPRAARLATMFANPAYVPKEVCPFKILSINRVHEVFGHFFSPVLDSNDLLYKFKEQSA
jgi:hypothetical protein